MLQIQGCNGILEEPLDKVNGVVVVQKPQKTNLRNFPNSNSGKKSKEAAVLHALAEKGRRKRINEHLQTLRHLFPELAKKQKASVLMEAVQRLKELKRKVAEHVSMENEGEGGCNGRWPLFLPGEKDEVKVVSYSCGVEGEEQIMQVKATICCEDRQRLNADLTEAVRSVNGRLVKAEMSTIGGRTKAVLVVQLCREGGGGGGEDDLRSFRMALKAVVEDRALTCPLLLGSKMIEFGMGQIGQ